LIEYIKDRNTHNFTFLKKEQYVRRN